MISSSKGINREDQVAAKQWISGPSLKQASYLVIVVAMIALASIAKAGVRHVSFQSNGFTLHGCITKPAGKGPFPAIIFNHGSEKNPEPCGPPDLAEAYAKRGYGFFAFQRHGHGSSRGAYVGDLQQQILRSDLDPAAKARRVTALHEEYNLDVVGAILWLKEQPEIDPHRLAMTGISFGGIQALLCAEKGLGLRAFLPFAPAAMSWGNAALRERLMAAVRKAKAPIFLIQAANDYSLGPSEMLGPVIKEKGTPNAAKIYPTFGSSHQQGHWQFAASQAVIAIWGPEVFSFLDAVMR